MAIDSGTPERRSRRTILAGALGAATGLLAGRFGTADRTSAAAGGPVIMGAANSAGVTNTSLATSSAGTALLVTQNGAGTALRGSAVGAGSIAGFFTANNGTGISGVTGNGGSYGVFAQNNGVVGTAGALRASGGNNHGVVATTANAGANAVKAINTSVAGIAILGQASATTGSNGQGVAGRADGQYGVGVYGLASSVSGTPNGVRGVAEGPAGNAVSGQMTSGTFGDGVAVRADGGVNHGVVGSTAYEFAYGVKGTNSGDSGTAIKGEATSTNGITKGVHGEIAGAGYAVYGHAGIATGPGFGLYGVVDSTTGYAVSGIVSAVTGINIGVYGETSSSTGYGVYSWGDAHVVGNLGVTGTLTKGGGTFKIDHPLDPANKFLYHSFVESPDMMNIYNGIATLDSKGEATVRLPDWFGSLNKDFRYQLTPIGQTDRILYVKSEVKNNAFGIGGGQAGQRVSWQLTGIRQDAWANAHRVVAEVAKTGAEKGRYLHPKEHGQPASKGIDALHARPTPAAVAARAAQVSGH